jgi:hypothetical protein
MPEQRDQNRGHPDCPSLVQISNDGQGVATFPDLDLQADPELVAQGWERRFMADPLQVKEATRLYKELGFEVHQEPVKPDEFNAVCAECSLTACKTYLTIYTRKPSF